MTKIKMTDEEALELVFDRINGNALAKALGINRQSIYLWKKVPVHHARAVAQATGLDLDKVLPSVYG